MARTFAIYKPALKNQYTIIGPSRDTSTAEERIFVKLRPALKKRPFLVIYDGPDASCPVAAVSHLPAFARHFAIGRGDPKFTDTIWEELRIAHSSGKKHTWAMDVPGDDGQQRRLHLLWTRTRSHTVDGMTRPPLSTRNWKLTEILPAAAEGHGRQDGKEATAESILAVFTSTTQMGKCGNMQVNVDYGREFDMMLFATCLSIYSSG